MHTTARYRFSPSDARKTFFHLDVLWGQMTDGRDGTAADADARALASAIVGVLDDRSGVTVDPTRPLESLDAAGRAADDALARGALEADVTTALLDTVMTALEHGSDALRAAGQMPATRAGVAQRLQLSDGGVPKTPRPMLEIGFRGVEGDRQRSRQHHGRPWQALCLWSVEVIEELRAEGHPVGPGLAGENVTIAGLDWSEVRGGVRLRIGTALAQASVFALPCRNIAGCFSDRRSTRIHHDRGPVSRVYATVLEPGRVAEGDAVVLEPRP